MASKKKRKKSAPKKRKILEARPAVDTLRLSCVHCKSELDVEFPASAGLGTRVKILRETLGLYQLDFSKLVGLGSAHGLKLIEIGVQNPSLKTVRRMCERLDISMDKFLGSWVPDSEPKN